MLSISTLLAIVDAYRAATGLEDKTVSSRVFDDSKKIAQMREGGDITVGRFNAALLWFSQNWPADAIWPEEIERPSIEEPAFSEAAE